MPKSQAQSLGLLIGPLSYVRYLGFVLLTLLPMQAGAYTSLRNVIVEAEAQIIKGQYSAAINVLEMLGPQEDSATEQRRLWVLAVAHVRANQPRASIPYLERLVSLAPGNASYRLELASALDRSGQLERARYHYDLSRGSQLATDLAQEVSRRIDRIDRAKSWEGSFEIALTPESNAARRTEAETVFIGNLPFRLRSESRAEPAQGVKLGFGLTALPKLGPDLRLRMGFNTEARLFKGSTPNDTQVIAELGLMHLGDRSRRIGGGLLLGRRWINGSEYSSSRGGYLTWGRSMGKEDRTGVSLTVLRDWTSYNSLGPRAASRTLAAGRLTHLVSPQLQLRIGLQVEKVDSQIASESGNTVGLNFGASYAFSGGGMVDLELSASELARDKADTFFGIRREDSRRGVRLRFTHRDWSIGGFAPVAEIAFEKQISNNVIYSYKNTRAAIGFTRQF